MNAQEALIKYWNHSSFRYPQEEIINTVLQEKNVFAQLPTGSGKSICFQIPALIIDGISIVISPLIALMQDQVKNLKEKGIKAVALSSSLKQNEIVELFDNLRYGGYKFLYLSPERLQSEFIQEKIKQLNVKIIVVDEAHCISEWGHDFRPAYRKIDILQKIHPKAITIALTASATKKVADDILYNLGLKNVIIFRKTLNRPELVYKTQNVEDINYAIKYYLSKKKGSPSIIYTSSRKATRTLSQYLNRNGHNSTYYHGGLSVDQKKEAYQDWLEEKAPVIVATNAFGMGIDKQNVATIIHANLPFSLENYLQESGRAGRNGKKSEAILLYNNTTIHQFERQFKKEIISIDFLKDVYKKLNQFYHIANGEKPLERFEFDINEFCNTYDLPYIETFTALNLLEKESIIALNQNFSKKSSLKFIGNQHQLFGYGKQNSNSDQLIKTLLRTYGGLFEQYTKIDELIISKKIGAPKDFIITQLKNLHKLKLIDYKVINSDYTLLFLVPREDNYTINNIAKNIKQRSKIKQQKFDAVLNYVNNNDQCRSKRLLSYFGDKNLENCGVCDVCQPKNNSNVKSDYRTTSNLIIKLLKEKDKLTSRKIIEILSLDKNLVLTTLQLLLEKNKITLTSHNKFELNSNA